MQAIEEFMQSFFDERYALARAAKTRATSFLERCFTERYLTASEEEYGRAHVYEKVIPSVVLKTEINKNYATVITSEPELESMKRRIYKLRFTNKGWQIDRRGRECYLCNGTGVFEDETCDKCEGKKWLFSRASIR